MATVQKSDVFFFPFHARLIKAQPNIRPVPLGEVNGRWTAWRRSDYFYAEMIPEPDYSESDEGKNTSSEDEEEPTKSNKERSRSPYEERLRDVEEEDENEEDANKRRIHLASPGSKKGRDADQPNKTKSGSAPRLKKSQSADEDLIKPKQPSSPILASSESLYKEYKEINFKQKQKSQAADEDLIKPKKPSNPILDSSESKDLFKELKFKQKHGISITNQKSELQKALEKYSENCVRKAEAGRLRTSLETILEKQARKLDLQERDGNSDNPEWITRLQRQHVPRLYDPKKDEFFRVHARVVSNLMDDASPIASESDS